MRAVIEEKDTACWLYSNWSNTHESISELSVSLSWSFVFDINEVEGGKTTAETILPFYEWK